MYLECVTLRLCADSLVTVPNILLDAYLNALLVRDNISQ